MIEVGKVKSTHTRRDAIVYIRQSQEESETDDKLAQLAREINAQANAESVREGRDDSKPRKTPTRAA